MCIIWLFRFLKNVIEMALPCRYLCEPAILGKEKREKTIYIICKQGLNFMPRGGRGLVASMKKSESSDFILTWEVFGAKGHHVREKAADNEFEEFLKEDWAG